jgi:hypothetical protein
MGGGDPIPVPPGLYLTSAEFAHTFEGWFKGDPEFEIHILGPAAVGDTKNLSSFQCIGEHAGGSYGWDMNQTTWQGKQLLFSNQQIEAYRAVHGTTPWTVLVLEDDDTACQIKTDNDRAEKLLAAIGAFTADMKGLEITFSGGERIVRGARSGFKLLGALYSFITTADDIVGLALDDKVTGRYRATSNWTVFDDVIYTNGHLKLEVVN